MAHKILMLGGRRSGKSSILASVVYALGKTSELFSITDQTIYTAETVSLNEKRLELENYLKKRKNSSLNSNFRVDMAPTNGMVDYNIMAQIRGASDVMFDFVDVQGEAMEVQSKFHQSLKEQVALGDVFIVAIDTPYLMQDEDENINTVWNRTDEITNLLANIHIEDEDIDRKLIILCPVKCEKWTQHGKAEKVTERVCNAYKRLINNWVNHRAVDIWVMPVETAGGIEHSKLLDGYRIFKNDTDKVGELGSIHDLTGQVMLKNGDIVSPSSVIIENEPDKSLVFSSTQIPLSWFVVNGKGYSPARCEQPAYHIIRFLVKKEEKATEAKKKAIDETIWIFRWWRRLWNPPFGQYLNAYRNLIDDMERNHLIKTNGDGFKKIETIVK